MMTHSTTSQDLILAKIEELVTRRGLQMLRGKGVVFAIDGEYSNTGTIRVYDENLNQLGEISYDFQRTYCHFYERPKSWDGLVAGHYYGKPRTATQVPEIKSSIQELVETVVEHLLGSGTP